jgi:molybdate-binding protein
MNDALVKEMVTEKLNLLFNDAESAMIRGYSRWEHEREYEDINDYSVLFEKTIKKYSLNFVRMTERPFGFIVRVEFLNADFHFSIDSKGTYTWKYIKNRT